MLFTRVYAFIAILGVTLALSIWGGGQLLKEFRYGYTVLFPGINSHNLVRLYWDYGIEKVVTTLTASSEPGLPIVQLYIPENGQKQLLSNVFDSTKEWQKAFQLYPDNELHPVKVRHLGDNPYNWGFDKKTWRIKTRKWDQLGGLRNRNYRIPQSAFMLENHLAAWFAKSLALPAPDSRMVEVMINGQSFGVYQEQERLDESFLRRNQIMPVNLYKGEQVHIEKSMRRSIDLFDNPDLWRKNAVFNQWPKEDHRDLAKFIDTLRQAMTSDQAWQQFIRIAPPEAWAKMAVLAVLTQSYHNDDVHNMRLLSDPWKGTITPVPTDVGAFYDRPPFFIDFASHPVWKLYMGSSRFLWERDRLLYASVVTKQILGGALDIVESLLPTMKASYSRAPHRVQWKERFLDYDAIDKKDLGLPGELDRVVSNMGAFDLWLRTRLTAAPQSTWKQNGGGVQLVVTDTVPVSHVEISMSSNSPRPKRIVWDANFDGHLSEGDLDIPFSMFGNTIQLDAIWLANRVQAGNIQVKSVPTAFNLFADIPLHATAVKAANALNGLAQDLDNNPSAQGATPGRLNLPLVVPAPEETEQWPLEITIDKDTVVDRPVTIAAGSVIRMHPGTSLIFQNRVEVRGTADARVRIMAANKGEIWGTVALFGAAANGSRISHLSVSGGSGGVINGVRYTSMLSVHGVDDVDFTALELSDNHDFDDMMHIVYSNHIQLKQPHFKGALSDALDIDMSHNIRIVDGLIEDAGNDAIDLMSSSVLVAGMRLENSGDKGISVGEGSTVLTLDSTLRNNKIGVEAKDGSIALIGHSTFIDNKKPVNAYAKNWRYGLGGTVRLDKVIVRGANNELKTDKLSHIAVSDSAFVSGCPQKSSRLTLEPTVDCRLIPELRNDKLDPSLEEAVTKWHRRPAATQRGAPS